MQVEVEFTKDFAGKKKGETGTYYSTHAQYLVKVDKVAKYPTKSKKKPKAKAKK